MNTVEITRLFSLPEIREWWHATERHIYLPSFAKKIDKYVKAVP